MHRFNVANERSLVLLTAGNLATSQAVVAQLHRDLADDNEMNIAKARYVSEVADYIGQISSVERAKYQKLVAPTQKGLMPVQRLFSAAKSKGRHRSYLIYPEGNHITASEQHPTCKLGKPSTVNRFLIVSSATKPRRKPPCDARFCPLIPRCAPTPRWDHR